MTMQRTPLLLSRLLDRGARLAPDDEIVTARAGGVHRQTYAPTRARACQLAHVLHTLNIRLSPRELEYIIGHAADRVILVDADLLPLLEKLRGRMPSVERIVVGTASGGFETAFENAVDWEEWIGSEPVDYRWPELDENAPLGLCYTSGTTGNPKGVMYTHRSTYLHTMAQAMTDAMSLSATDSVCGIVPMFHAMGWGLPFTATMLGAKQVMPHRFMDPKSLLDLMAAEEVTISAGVPTIWQGAKAALEAEPKRWDLSKLERLTCGGSAPPLALNSKRAPSSLGSTRSRAASPSASTARSRSTSSSRTSPRRGSRSRASSSRSSTTTGSRCPTTARPRGTS